MGRVSLRETLVWFVVLLAFGLIAESADALSASALFTAAVNHNLIYILIYAALLSRALAIGPQVAASGGDVAMLGIAAVGLAGLSFIGIAAADGAPALLVGLYLLRRRVSVRDVNLHAIGAVLLAFGAHLFLARALRVVFQAEIVAVDSFLLEVSLRLTGDLGDRVGNHVANAEGFGIAIVGACSVFTNISLLIPAVVAAAMWVRPRLTRRDLWCIVGGSVALTALNTLRLRLMAESYEGYLYWHEGGGATIIAIAQTLLVLACAATAARPWLSGPGARRVPA